MSESPRLRAVITGTGSAVPERVMTNHDFELLVETSDEWIVQRTGIRERRICGPTDTTASLSLEASKRALSSASIDPATLDLIVVATVTGDYPWPATACFIQDGLGAVEAGAFDISAACAGFVYAVANVTAMIETRQIRTALVIGADTLSKQADWSDRSTCILFGDGAAACVLEAKEASERGVVATVLRSAGSGAKHIIMERGGSKHPYNAPGSEAFSDRIKMAGKEVYRFAINAMGDACEAVMRKAGLTTRDVDLFVPHQANLRIIESAASRLGFPDERIFVNVDRYGNTSGASIPLALDEAVRSGRLCEGMNVLTVGFGAGFVWGASIIRW